MVETNEIVNALATSISAEKAYDSFIKYLTKLDNQDFLKVAKVFAYKNDNKFALNIPNAVNHNMVDLHQSRQESLEAKQFYSLFAVKRLKEIWISRKRD